LKNHRSLLVVLPAATAHGTPAARHAQQISIVMNWFEELNAPVPTK